MKPTVSTAVSLLLCTVGLVAWLHAGPLNPPAGPVASSYKTLTEVEPRIAINAANTPGDADSLYKITQPGSYYLTGNITGAAAKHGIEIVASDVSLDLSGFELLGVAGSLDGISATVGLNSVEVRNGSVRSWGDEGLDFTNGGTISVVDLGVLGCAGFGISVNTNSTVSRCRVQGNAGGIATGINCIVTGCTADTNAVGGILAWVGCRVTDCVANNNTGNGISANNGSTISGCSGCDNTGHGIAVPNGCTISNCSASSNDLNGISAGDGAAISGCAASGNFGSGIVVVTGGTVTACSSRSNSVNGITATSSCTISFCNLLENNEDGIHVGNSCYAFNNQCRGDGSTSASIGIHIQGSENRVEANVLTGNMRGLKTDGTPNIIIRNTARGNGTNWDISAGNRGEAVFASGNGVGYSGTAGGVPIGSTDPWVNFSY